MVTDAALVLDAAAPAAAVEVLCVEEVCNEVVDVDVDVDSP